MPKKIPDEVKQEAVRLRTEERLGLEQIKRRTGLSKGTLSGLLRDIPLTVDEIRRRVSQATLRANASRRHRSNRSKFAQMVDGKDLSTERKGQIAEAAVWLRLILLGYEIRRSLFEGSRDDCLVSRPGVERRIRLQVKWARQFEEGRPMFAVCNGEHGKIRRLTRDYCDFVVAYGLESDTAFVIPVEVCEGKYYKACDEKYAEAWHLLSI